MFSVVWSNFGKIILKEIDKINISYEGVLVMSGLFLNFFECILSSNEVEVFSLPYNLYSSKESLKSLRESNREYSFYKYNYHIYYWLRQKNEKFIPIENSTLEIINLIEHPAFASKILEEGLVNFFRKHQGVSVHKNTHSNTWEIESHKDLLHNKIPGLKSSELLLV